MNAKPRQKSGKPNYWIIDAPAGLENVAKKLENEPIVAVDLEADSMYHYREKVCLLQIATNRLNLIVDPLLVPDMSPLKRLFKDRGIPKIFHGADYDVRCLYRDFKIKINNLFDTQVACRFLGIKETGLDAVIRNTFNIGLNKKYQKKDWSRRPLPEDMMDYAARDAIYLLPLAKILREQLVKTDRLSWVLEECDLLSRVRAGTSDGGPLFLKFKGAGRFRPRGLVILESLLRFREKAAEKKDRPVFRIFSNEALIKLAVARPVTLNRLKHINVLGKKQFSMYGASLVQVIEAALNIPDTELPEYPRKTAPATPPEVPARVRALKAKRDALARSLDIDPALLCNKSLLYAIAARNPLAPGELKDIPGMKNWQKKAFGNDAVRVLKKGIG